MKGFDKTLYFTPEGVTFALPGCPGQEAQRWVVKLDFVDADPKVTPEGRERQAAVFSYFRGKPEEWKAAVPTYGKVVYEDLWPGIDLVFSGNVNELKYDFIVEPGADPAKIRLEYRGATAAYLEKTGEVLIATPAGFFEDGAPRAYQERDSGREAVSARNVVDGPDAGGVVACGFEIGDYDRTRPLVIDPFFVIYGGYIGGAGRDTGLGIAVDSSGNAYVAGATSSSESTFPECVGPDSTYNGGGDAFVAKVKSDGSGLVYCGYIGGTQEDSGWGIAVDGEGSVYVAGVTESSEAQGFPVLVGPDLSHNGASDMFVAKVNLEGTGLVYCGYIGGSDSDACGEEYFAWRPYDCGVAVDSQGAAYVAGDTRSSESEGFPVMLGPDLTYNGGGFLGGDAFVAKVNENGTGLVYCGYIGGAEADWARNIDVDGQGDVYVTGGTESTPADGFPAVVGPDLTYNGGEADAFVAKIDSESAGLVFCGYIGGSWGDHGMGIAVDHQGCAYVTGHCNYFDGDAFLSRVATDGAGLDYFTVIPVTDDYDWGTGVAVDSDRNAFVSGACGYYPWYPGETSPETFVAALDPDGAVIQSWRWVFPSGNAYNRGEGVAVGDDGSVYMTGGCQISLPIVRGGPDLTHNGGYYDAYVFKLDPFAPGPVVKVNGKDHNFTTSHTTPLTVTVSLDPAGYAGEMHDWWIWAYYETEGLRWWWVWPGQWIQGGAQPAITWPLVPVNNYKVGQAVLPAGVWWFNFAVDAPDGVFQGTYLDDIKVTLN